MDKTKPASSLEQTVNIDTKETFLAGLFIPLTVPEVVAINMDRRTAYEHYHLIVKMTTC